MGGAGGVDDDVDEALVEVGPQGGHVEDRVLPAEGMGAVSHRPAPGARRDH